MQIKKYANKQGANKKGAGIKCANKPVEGAKPSRMRAGRISPDRRHHQVDHHNHTGTKTPIYRGFLRLCDYSKLALLSRKFHSKKSTLPD